MPALLGKLRSIRRTGVVIAASVLTPGIATVASAVCDPASGSALALAIAWPDSASNRSLRRSIQANMLAAASGVGKRVKDPFWRGAASAPSKAADAVRVQPAPRC